MRRRRDAATPRRFGARALALLVGIALSLALAEIMVRVLAPQAGTYAGHAMYVADPDVGYRLRPGHRWGPIHVNAQGLRDVERPVAKPEGRRRVVVVGDSFAFGPQIEIEQVFPRQLERLLGAGVEVVNGGVPGYSTARERKWFERYGLAYQPDAVVLAFYVGNDPLENTGTPDVVVVDGELVPRGSAGRSTWFRIADRSHAFRLLRSLFAPRPVAGGDRTARYHAIVRDHMGVCARAPGKVDYELGWRVAREQIAAIRAAAAQVPMVVLVIPDEFQVDAALRGAVAERFGLALDAYDIDAPQHRIAAVCAELGLPLVDPLPEMRRRTEAGERLYLENDSHWNAAGNRLAAERLAELPELARLRAAGR